MTKRDPNELMTPSEAARLLGLSADSVRAMSDGGRLPTLRTVSGRRLFRRADVEHLVAERARRRAEDLGKNGRNKRSSVPRGRKSGRR